MDCSPPDSSVHGGFPRQDYGSRLPLPSPGAPPHLGIEPESPALQVDSLLLEPPVVAGREQRREAYTLFWNCLPIFSLTLGYGAVSCSLYISSSNTEPGIHLGAQ